MPFEMLQEKMPVRPEETIGKSIRSGPKDGERDAGPDVSLPRIESDAAASANNEPEQTEIHITIGSVELRAPRVAPVAPKSLPFRPRVTLDEFLRRGSGSSGRGAKS
jgi:hypothetical protein